jgi:hypothetical protein
MPQPLEEQSPEQTEEHLHRQEETTGVRATQRLPSGARPPPGNHTVRMGMMQDSAPACADSRRAG